MTTTSLHLARTAALFTERSDRELLDLFVRHRDEEAFADVVRRHGPMVLGVCRRVLRNGAAADDAFQAALLVLARRAASIASADRLANWLYGVAFNTARKLRRANVRRSRREVPRATLPDAPARPDAPREWLELLDDELTRLPEKYRTAIVLCDLEGQTRGEVARALGWPEGTVAGRLARARELLGRRLAARGVVPGTVAVLVVPSTLVTASARAAARGIAPQSIAALTDGVIRTMIHKKLRTAAALVFAGVVAVAGLSTLPSVALTQPPAAKAPDPRPGVSDPRGAVGSTAKTLTAFPLRDVSPEKAVKELAAHMTALLTPLPQEHTLLVYADVKTTRAIEEDLKRLGEVRFVTTVVDVAGDPERAIRLVGRFYPTGATPTMIRVPGERRVLVHADEATTRDVLVLLSPVTKAVPPEPTFTIEFRDAQWVDVLKWYAKISGLLMISASLPPGTCTLLPGKDMKFTLVEITDMINEALATHKMMLVLREKSFFIWPTDEKYDPYF